MKKHKKIENYTKQECETIDQYLTKYEKDKGIILKNIAICNDKVVTYYYNNISNKSALCYRPLALEWSDNGSINYWTNRKLTEVKMPQDIYNTHFKDKNWDMLNVTEQLICIDDTVYYCIY